MRHSIRKTHIQECSGLAPIDVTDISDHNRPVLIHLNADTTWLLQIPRIHTHGTGGYRSHYNILIDPWLRGRQSDVAFWFSSQWHAIKSSVQTISELNAFLAHTQRASTIECALDHQSQASNERRNYIDAVVVSHEFTDHCHKRTLLEVDPTVPVFATAKAALMIKSWHHFRQVLEPAAFSQKQADWRASSPSALPDWIGISRIVSHTDALYYHSAIMIAFDLSSRIPDRDEGDDMAEAVIYTPHGIQAQDLGCLEVAKPPVRTIALMHGLHDVKISAKQLNLGAHNGLQAQRICRARYWVSTHDEVKKARGFIAPMLHRKQLTLKDALEEEEKRGVNVETTDLSMLRDMNFADMKSGQSIVLR